MNEVNEADNSNKIEAANRMRLRSFEKEKSIKKESPFKLMNQHPYLKDGDNCVVVGTVDHVCYLKSYKSKEKAKEAVKQLNEQFFD